MPASFQPQQVSAFTPNPPYRIETKLSRYTKYIVAMVTCYMHTKDLSSVFYAHGPLETCERRDLLVS